MAAKITRNVHLHPFDLCNGMASTTDYKRQTEDNQNGSLFIVSAQHE